jgi:hypothetical protein
MLVKFGSAKSTESELLVENRTWVLPRRHSRIEIKNSVFVQISVWCCSFSLAVSVGAALLLPISTISNEVNSSCLFQGSGSESGSTYFWASWIRFRILLSSSKNSKKNLDSYYFVTSFGLFIFEK